MTNKVVTIWHFGDDAIPVRKVYKNVLLDSVKRIEKNGIKQKGFFDGTTATVRIFVTENIDVLPGDYLFIGESLDAVPENENCIKIIEVKDNRRGGQKHWRIVCGG